MIRSCPAKLFCFSRANLNIHILKILSLVVPLVTIVYLKFHGEILTTYVKPVTQILNASFCKHLYFFFLSNL